MRVVSILLLLISISAVRAQTGISPYAADQNREIKALSQEEIQGYLDGQGMGFAMAAELNHYPGPKHVLELSEALSLTAEQKVRTEAVFDEMQKRARELGKKIVGEEKELNTMFATEEIKEKSLRESTLKISTLIGSLRAEHLAAHLKMKEILSAEQIRMYDELRGYRSGNTRETHKMNHQHHR